jgi:hypothetical protein
MVRLNKKLLVAGLLAITGAGAALSAATSKKDDVKYTNLKVLPKNISSRELQGIMVDDFQDGLGVTCNFCHANSADGHGLDFASDARPEKEISRAMMRMTLGINKKYFKVKHPLIGSNALTVTCNTCHKGQAFPDGDAEQK